jgi:hypothetical protein
MNRIFYLLRNKIRLTVCLNCLVLAGIMALRFMQPSAVQRPNVSLAHSPNISVAHWLGDRLADGATLIGTLLHRLVQ